MFAIGKLERILCVIVGEHLINNKLLDNFFSTIYKKEMEQLNLSSFSL